MRDLLSAHADHFRKQAEWCQRLGSPFNAALLNRLARRLGDGSVLDRLVAGGETPLRPTVADVAPLRVAGALHAMTLSGRDQDLAAQYPAARAAWDMDAVIPVALAAMERHERWTRDFLTRPPQTNETRRAVGLLAGFARLEGPLHLLEVGASAGLNLHWDAFGYDGGGWSRPGAPGAPVQTTHWTGPPPDLPERFEIASRRACDRTPIDLTDPDQRLRLAAYVWPDQTERLERLEAAIGIALERGVCVEAADAADWLERMLAGPLPEGTSVIYHSIAWQYFDADTHARAMAAIKAAGARADAGHRLAWLRFEHEKVFGGPGREHVVDLLSWPGGRREELVIMDPHGLSARRV